MAEVILVNEKDEVIGAMEKMQAHTKGLLHRAFSVFIFNSKGEMLIQQRAEKNTTVGAYGQMHVVATPMPGEDIADAAHRRLSEEMGFDTEIKKAFTFSYQSSFKNGLTENEFDHVFTGIYDGEISPVENEVKDYCFMSLDDIRSSLESHPLKYTEWFKIAFPKLEKYLGITQ